MEARESAEESLSISEPSFELPTQVLYKNLQCPICLELLRNAYCVKECLHRFCKYCLDMALSKNGKQCPICRTPIRTRRHTRPDVSVNSVIFNLGLRESVHTMIADPNYRDYSYSRARRKKRKLEMESAKELCSEKKAISGSICSHSSKTALVALATDIHIDTSTALVLDATATTSDMATSIPKKSKRASDVSLLSDDVVDNCKTPQPMAVSIASLKTASSAPTKVLETALQMQIESESDTSVLDTLLTVDSSATAVSSSAELTSAMSHSLFESVPLLCDAVVDDCGIAVSSAGMGLPNTEKRKKKKATRKRPLSESKSGDCASKKKKRKHTVAKKRPRFSVQRRNH